MLYMEAWLKTKEPFWFATKHKNWERNISNKQIKQILIAGMISMFHTK